jgi:hypothetical protein
MNSIQAQAGELWQTLSERDTAVTYKQAAVKTWKVLKQGIILIVSLALLSIAIVLWIWSVGFNSGRSFREWLETEKPAPNEILGVTIYFLLWPFERAFDWAKDQVQKSLGWTVKIDAQLLESTGQSKALPTGSEKKEV